MDFSEMAKIVQQEIVQLPQPKIDLVFDAITTQLLDIPNVIGVGDDGSGNIVVFSRVPNIQNVPSEIDGFKIKVIFSGQIDIY